MTRRKIQIERPPLWQSLAIIHSRVIEGDTDIYTTGDLAIFSKDVSNVAGMYLIDRTSRREIVILGKCEPSRVQGQVFYAEVRYTHRGIHRGSSQYTHIMYKESRGVPFDNASQEEIIQGGLEQVARVIKVETEAQTQQTITKLGEFPLKGATLSEIKEGKFKLTLREA